jgi:carboxyl-terminal processing protease
VDTHNSYYTKEELKEFMDSMTSGFVGIGIQILTSGNGIRVVGVIKDGPADKSGQLKERDVIVAIDGDANKATLPLTEATKFLKGKPGSTVSVDIERDGKVIKDIVITRGTVNTASNATKSEVIEKAGKKLGYLTFSSFFSGNYKLGIKGIAGVVKDKLAELNNQNIEGLVLDLRNNPGGSLHDVVDILGQLIGPNTFVQTLNYRGSHDYLKSYEKNVFDKPLVVMVNEGSASASEVLAGNLKDFNRALVVGTKSTFGKGLVQTVDTDPFTNDAHKLTTSGYYLASGSSPQYSGVESDVVITASDEDSISERTINPLMKDFPPLDSLFKLKAAKKWLGDSEMNWVRTKMAQTNYLTTVNDKDTQKEVEKEQAFKVLVNYMSFLQKASSDPNYDLAEAN